MNKPSHQLRMLLEQVLISCQNSAELYMLAADRTSNSDLQNTFLLYSLQRRNFAEHLFHETLREGFNLKPGKQMSVIFRMMAKHIQLSLASGNDQKLVDICKTSEEALLQLYVHVLPIKQLSDNMYKLLAEHRSVVLNCKNTPLIPEEKYSAGSEAGYMN